MVPIHGLAYSFGWREAKRCRGIEPDRIDLVERDGGTLLRMTHSGLPDATQVAYHDRGWAHYLGRLAPRPQAEIRDRSWPSAARKLIHPGRRTSAVVAGAGPRAHRIFRDLDRLARGHEQLAPVARCLDVGQRGGPMATVIRDVSGSELRLFARSSRA